MRKGDGTAEKGLKCRDEAAISTRPPAPIQDALAVWRPLRRIAPAGEGQLRESDGFRRDLAPALPFLLDPIEHMC